jgi:hypothetical protein
MSYRATLERAEQLLNCLQPNLILMNAMIGVDWEPVVSMLYGMGYSTIKLAKGGEEEIRRVKITLGADGVRYRARLVILAELDTLEQLGKLRTELLGDRVHSFIYLYPNNPREYAKWRMTKGADKAVVRADLDRNRELWQRLNEDEEGAFLTILL